MGGLVGCEEEQIMTDAEAAEYMESLPESHLLNARRSREGMLRKEETVDQIKRREKGHSLGRDSKMGRQGAPKQLRAKPVLRTEALLLDLILSTL